MIEQISVLLWLLRGEGTNHPLFGMSPKQWRRAVNEKVETLRKEPLDAKALIELCKLDPRYLGTELALATILRSKLQLIWSEIVIGKPSERSKAARAQLTAVKARLAGLAGALSHVSGKGLKNYRLRSFIRDDFAYHVRVFEEVREELQANFTDARVREFAKRFDIPEKTVRDLRRARQVEGKVEEYLATRRGISPPRLRALRTGKRRSKRS